MLNGSQARFYHLNLYAEDLRNPGEAKVGTPGPTMYQVGPKGGFLPAGGDPQQPNTAATVGDPDDANPDGPFNLLLAPAERADVVIDFNGVPAGSTFILYNDCARALPRWGFSQRLLHRRRGSDGDRRSAQHASGPSGQIHERS